MSFFFSFICFIFITEALLLSLQTSSTVCVDSDNERTVRGGRNCTVVCDESARQDTEQPATDVNVQTSKSTSSTNKNISLTTAKAANYRTSASSTPKSASPSRASADKKSVTVTQTASRVNRSDGAHSGRGLGVKQKPAVTQNGSRLHAVRDALFSGTAVRPGDDQKGTNNRICTASVVLWNGIHTYCIWNAILE